MTASHPRPIGVQTPAQLRQTQRRLDRRRQQVDRVLAIMKAGCTLHYANGRATWQLSNGQAVAADTAGIVTTKSCIVGVGDTLLPCCTFSQTWRFSDE